ncbi:MAG TPA: MFS transporter [Steroidobacter sp.]|uniref:MFS transporter n=1 Tax=Steroidobacter sp. TaxID=1978227 RepID=UPI002EDB0101
MQNRQLEPAPSLVTNNGTIGPERWSRLQMLVVALCFVINMLDGMDVLILSYVAPAFSADWNIAPDELGMLFSSGLAGMAAGGILIAPLADRFGRRPLIISALIVSSVAMVSSGFVETLAQFLVLRFAVGIGIGTVLPSMAAIVAEYAPEKHRSFAVGLLQAGYPVGATITGFVAATVIPIHGWRATLIGAGLISAAMVPLTMLLLPESVQFLRARISQPHGKMAEASTALRFGSSGVAGLVSEGRFVATLLLWTAVSLGFMTLYFIISWIPKLAIAAGVSESHAIYTGAILNIGSFSGTILIGRLSTRLKLQNLVCAFLVSAAIVLAAYGSIPMPAILTLFAAFIVGFLLQGGFNGLYPLAASVYPAHVRSTGIGWAMGIGRVGAVLGPLLGGVLLAREVPLAAIFAVFGVPVLLAGVCALFVRAADPGERAVATCPGGSRQGAT